MPNIDKINKGTITFTVNLFPCNFNDLRSKFLYVDANEIPSIKLTIILDKIYPKRDITTVLRESKVDLSRTAIPNAIGKKQNTIKMFRNRRKCFTSIKLTEKPNKKNDTTKKIQKEKYIIVSRNLNLD